MPSDHYTVTYIARLEAENARLRRERDALLGACVMEAYYHSPAGEEHVARGWKWQVSGSRPQIGHAATREAAIAAVLKAVGIEPEPEETT